jgi:MerC mercury resistance protein
MIIFCNVVAFRYFCGMSSTHKVNWDALGVAASIACAFHCAALPLLISSLPVFGVNIVNNAPFEYGMILLAFCIGSFSLVHGYRKHHGRLIPMLFFAAGMGFLLAKQRWHDYELGLLPFAVVFIVSAHLLNFRLIRRLPLKNDPKNAASN